MKVGLLKLFFGGEGGGGFERYGTFCIIKWNEMWKKKKKKKKKKKNGVGGAGRISF